MEDPLITTARNLAREAHEGQTRTRNGELEPYFNHCERVAQSVALLTDRAHVIAAAYLHDVIEDTPYTHLSLAAAFEEAGHHYYGEVVAIVDALTDHYTPEPGINREARKTLEAKRLKECHWEVRLVKLCDLLDNAQDIQAKGGGFAKVWDNEKARLVPMLLGSHWNT